jgi:hypothetical protein
VASAMKQNAVLYVAITSENGGPFTLANPWQGR